MNFFDAFEMMDPNKSLESQLTVARMNAIFARLQANEIVPGVGNHVSRVGGGLAINRVRPKSSSGPVTAYPFKVYNTTTGATGQVQINGGDGFVASLNGFVADVNGHPNDTKYGGPPTAYPQLAVTDNGVIYGYAVPASAGTASPLTSLDIYYAATLPAVDTSNPATFFPFLVASISGYAVDGSGNVSFTVNNTFGSQNGPSQLVYCAADGSIQIY